MRSCRHGLYGAFAGRCAPIESTSGCGLRASFRRARPDISVPFTLRAPFGEPTLFRSGIDEREVNRGPRCHWRGGLFVTVSGRGRCGCGLSGRGVARKRESRGERCARRRRGREWVSDSQKSAFGSFWLTANSKRHPAFAMRVADAQDRPRTGGGGVRAGSGGGRSQASEAWQPVG